MGLGKSLKKAFKSAVGVATLGAIKGGSEGWLGGTKGVTNILSLGAAGEGAIPNILNPNLKMPDVNIPDREAQFTAPNPTSLENVLANVDIGDAGEGELSLDPYRPRIRRQNTGLSNNVSQAGTGIRV